MKRKVFKYSILYSIPLLVVIIPFLFYYSIANTGTVPPERPLNIPGNSVWIGGPDGGLFYEVVNKDSISLRMRIYYENGALIEDGIFVGKKNLLIKCVIDSIYRYIEFSYRMDSTYYINLYSDWINRTGKLISVKSFIK